MKKSILVFALFFAVITSVFSQENNKSQKSCSVILLNDHWIINSYEKSEKAVVDKNTSGLISVHETGDISEKSYKKEAIPFKVAIQRKSDNTFFSYSNKVFDFLEVTEVLKECQSGDKIIVILEQNDNYSLPHNELEVL